MGTSKLIWELQINQWNFQVLISAIVCSSSAKNIRGWMNWESWFMIHGSLLRAYTELEYNLGSNRTIQELWIDIRLELGWVKSQELWFIHSY